MNATTRSEFFGNNNRPKPKMTIADRMKNFPHPSLSPPPSLQYLNRLPSFGIVLISTGRDMFIICLSIATASLNFICFRSGKFLVARWFRRGCEKNIHTDLNELSRAILLLPHLHLYFCALHISRAQLRSAIQLTQICFVYAIIALYTLPLRAAFMPAVKCDLNRYLLTCL